MKLLLDTSAYVGFKLGHPQLVDYLSQSDTIYVSPIMMGELVFGFRNVSRFQENMEGLNRFLSHEAVEKIAIRAFRGMRAAVYIGIKTESPDLPWWVWGFFI